jgi:hypothetical protein
LGPFTASVLYHREQGLTDPEIMQDRHHIAGPADRHGRGRDPVFENQQPAHDPGENLAQGAVGIGVGRTRHRHGRGQFGVAQARQRTGDAGDDEGKHDGGAGIGRGDLAGQNENARTDDGPDTEAHQVDGAERPLQFAARRLSLDLGDRFLDE